MSTTLKSKLLHQMELCKRIEQTLWTSISQYHFNAGHYSASNHGLNSEYELLPTNQRYRNPQFNRVTLKHSCAPVYPKILYVTSSQIKSMLKDWYVANGNAALIQDKFQTCPTIKY